MERCVVLNGDYTFLNTINWKRAVCLVIKGKSEVVKYSDIVLTLSSRGTKPSCFVTRSAHTIFSSVLGIDPIGHISKGKPGEIEAANKHSLNLPMESGAKSGASLNECESFKAIHPLHNASW